MRAELVWVCAVRSAEIFVVEILYIKPGGKGFCVCARKQQHREKKNNKKHKNFRPNIFKRLDSEIVVFLVFLFPAILSCIAGDGHLPQPFMNKFSNKLKTNETIANESFRRGSLIKRELIVFCSIVSTECKARGF